MKVFISHSHTHAELASRIAEGLEGSGLKVWDSDRGLLPGDNWEGEIAHALEESEVMIVFLTPATVRSPHVKREIEYALGTKNYANRLIPLVACDPDLFRSPDVPWSLGRMPCVELEDNETSLPKVEPIADAILSRDCRSGNDFRNPSTQTAQFGTHK